VNPRDADLFDLVNGGHAKIESAFGSAILRVYVTDAQDQGSVFAPIHWSAETSSHGRVGALVNPSTDPVSGQPELKATPVRLAPRAFANEGGFVGQRAIQLPNSCWWAAISLNSGVGYRMASDLSVQETAAWFNTNFQHCEITEFLDEEGGLYRAAAIKQGRVEAALFLGHPSGAPVWETLKTMLTIDVSDATRRRFLLSLQNVDAVQDQGPLVCACFGVCRGAIQTTIEGGAQNPAAVGAAIKAGTNCGSCIPEIRKMISSTLTLETAE
jgi:assimilatory nitrate reductase catalytic subunit